MRYLLDTNIASHIIKGDIPEIRQRLIEIPMHSVAVSAVTKGELQYGVAKRGFPEGLSRRVSEFLVRVDVLPWTSEVAAVYGRLRSACEAAGVSLCAMDMMIAAHARALQQEAIQQQSQSVTLVTRDKAFFRIPSSEEMLIERWA